MKNITGFALILNLLFLSSCGNTDNIESTDVVTKEAILVESFEELGKSDDVTINKTSLEGNLLTLDVSYSGGCKEHEFSLVGLKEIQKSYPPIRAIMLHHKGGNDICRELVSETLTFNITKFGFSAGEEIKLRLKGVDGHISYTL